MNTFLFLLLLCATPSPLNGERAGVRGEAVRLISVLYVTVANAIQSQRDCVTQPRHLRDEPPWEKDDDTYNPERVVASFDGKNVEGRNPVGVVNHRANPPRVARSSQPWALLRNPVGILQNSDAPRIPVRQIDDRRGTNPPDDWQTALRDMPLNSEILLNRDNCLPLMLRAFQSNGIVKALIFLPAVADDFYLISRDQPKLNIKAANLLAAVTALTNATAIRATFDSGLLLLHLDRDHLQPRVRIEDKPTAERMNTQSHLPRALWIDAHWERVQPQLREAWKLKILPAPKSTDAWHFARHNLAAWNLTDAELLAALSLAEKTTISVQKNRLVFRVDLNR